MTAIRALRLGITRVFRSARIVLLFYFVNLAAAVAAMAPAAIHIGSRLASSMESDRLFGNVDAAWIAEYLLRYRDGPGAWFAAVLVTMAVIFVLVNAFLAGGAIACFYRERETFFGAGARYFGRLFRLMLISLLFYGVVFGINRGLSVAIGHVSEESMVERPWVILSWCARAVFFLLIGVVNMIFDYGKIAVVTDDRKAVRATLRAFKFVACNPGRTLSVYWIPAAVGIALFGVYHVLSELIGQQSMVAVVAVFFLRQAYMLVRTWVRLWVWASETRIYCFSSTTVAPAPPSFAAAG
jgi:hypothetical protein